MVKKRMFWTIVIACSLFALFGITASATEEEAELPYIVPEGTIYYESAWGFGSGNKNVVETENSYTSIPCYATKTGYAFLDKDGKNLGSNFDPAAVDIEIPDPPEETVVVWYHFNTSLYQNGWVSEMIRREDHETEETHIEEIPKEADSQKEKEKTPEEIVTQIEEDINKKKTGLIIDFSGSMSSKQEQVVDLLGKIEYTEETVIIVFGTEYLIVTPQQLEERNFDVGGGTHMIQAVNEALKFDIEHLILITDLDTYGDVSLAQSKTLQLVTIYNPSYNEIWVDEFGIPYYSKYMEENQDELIYGLWGDYYIENVLRPTWWNIKITQIAIK